MTKEIAGINVKEDFAPDPLDLYMGVQGCPEGRDIGHCRINVNIHNAL